MKNKITATLARIETDLDQFCRRIGNRLAGSPAEYQAAEYTLKQFQEMGLSSCRILPYRCKRWIPGIGEIIARDAGRQKGLTIPCQIVTHSINGKCSVEGPVIFFEPIDLAHGLRQKVPSGSIGIFHGGYGENLKLFKAIQNSPLKAVICIDPRMQVAWPMAVGMGEKFGAYVRKPMVSISIQDAFRISRLSNPVLRMNLSGKIEEAESWNVTADLPGTNPEGSIIIASGHIDTVSAGVGADDNAAGVIATLELARYFSGQTRGVNTLRFIGFGAEEQLSVGSNRYVSEQVTDLDRIGFVCNFDGIGARVGISTVYVQGTELLKKWTEHELYKKQGFAEIIFDVSPYQDGFPFVKKGIPAIWYTRKTNTAGRWYFHSKHDNPDNVSCRQIERTVESAIRLLNPLVMKTRWPFPRAIAPIMRKKVLVLNREMF